MTDKKKILIIDDDPRNIFALTAVLKSKGYASVSAQSAAQGIDLLSAGGIGIVLMDMMMPDMDGYAAIQNIRGQTALASTPVVAVTAQAMQGDREKCMAAGANEYISKPIDTQKLIDILDKYIA